MLSWASKGDEAWLTILKSIGWGEVLTKQLLYALIKNVFRQLRAEWASGGAGLSALLWRHQIFSRPALPQHTLSSSFQPLICFYPISHSLTPSVCESIWEPILAAISVVVLLPPSLFLPHPFIPYNSQAISIFLCFLKTSLFPELKKKSQHGNHCLLLLMIK